jgi:hypothetical protein
MIMRKHSQARAVIAALAIDNGVATLAELGEFFCRDASTLSRQVGAARESNEMKRMFDKANNAIAQA